MPLIFILLVSENVLKNHADPVVGLRRTSRSWCDWDGSCSGAALLYEKSCLVRRRCQSCLWHEAAGCPGRSHAVWVWGSLCSSGWSNRANQFLQK